MNHKLSGLKILNLILNVVYQFSVVYILIHSLGPDIYVTIVVISAIGIYISNSDLGFSGFVYYSLREQYIKQDSPAVINIINKSNSIYFYISLAALLPVGLFVALKGHNLNQVDKIAVFIYMITIILNLPWTMMKKVLSAVDLYIFAELLDSLRRSSVLLIALLMLGPLSFLSFSILSLAIWIIVYILSVKKLNQAGYAPRLIRLSDCGAYMKESAGSLSTTTSYTAAEFFIYSFPYYLLPITPINQASVVLFDIFYKVVRFGGSAYGVFNESFLPQQTNHYHQARKSDFVKHQTILYGLNFGLWLIASLVLYFFGEKLVLFLLHGDNFGVNNVFIYAMILMLFGLMIQNTASSMMSGIGFYRILMIIATTTCAAYIILSLVTWKFVANFNVFLLAYVTVFIGYAGLTLWNLAKIVARKRTVT
jgi:O-antigen/teichoic acid export membrane protein